MRLPKLPCGHEVPEIYQRYLNAESWAFLTCAECNLMWRLKPLQWQRVVQKEKKATA